MTNTERSKYIEQFCLETLREHGHDVEHVLDKSRQYKGIDIIVDNKINIDVKLTIPSGNLSFDIVEYDNVNGYYPGWLIRSGMLTDRLVFYSYTFDNNGMILHEYTFPKQPVLEEYNRILAGANIHNAVEQREELEVAFLKKRNDGRLDICYDRERYKKNKHTTWFWIYSIDKLRKLIGDDFVEHTYRFSNYKSEEYLKYIYYNYFTEETKEN